MNEFIRNMFDVNFNWFNTIGLNNSTTGDWLQVVIGILSFCVAVVAAVIAWRTFRVAEKVQEAIAANHAKQKQVEVMCDLVKYLNEEKIQIRFIEPKKVGDNTKKENDVCFNLFGIGNLLKESVGERKEFDNSYIYITKEEQIIGKIKEYLFNPLVPKSIAEIMKHFFISKTKMVAGRPTDKTYIIVNQTSLLDSYYTSDCKALKDWKQFKDYSHQLSEAVSNWFNDNGIIDCNIRFDIQNDNGEKVGNKPMFK